MSTALKDLAFIDIYLGQTDAWLSGVPDEGDPVPAPESVRPELAELRARCEEAKQVDGKNEFAIRHADVAYRASTLISLNERVFVLRRLPSRIPDLETLGLHHGYVKRLMTKGLSGLIVFAGAFGQGKTTTASSLIQSRLQTYGGVAVTIEDPPEMPLEGRKGEGVCYQTWVDQGGFGQACRQAARWAPSIIFLGEVRDGETAQEALRASINGRLVICTTHADSVITAIDRIYSLACAGGSDSEDVSSLLAAGLAGVVHQRLEGEPKRIKTEFLWLREEESAGARNLIKQRDFRKLSSEINLQLNRMILDSRRSAPAAGSVPA